MPTSGSRGHVGRSAFRLRGKSARSVDGESNGSPSECGEFLHIGPALTGSTTNQCNGISSKRTLGPRAHSTLGSCSVKNGLKNEPNVINMPMQGFADGHLQISRTSKEKEKFTDRISLDRRGLSCIPTVVGESGLRLLSLQHNLLSSLSGLNCTPDFSNLVFLDVYDNQIDKISSLEALINLRVLLMGKNRIRRIEGLSCVAKLEVLDLHGNRITNATGLKGLNELKVLNLAGNQLRCVELAGLPELREMNLKRNRLRKLIACEGAPKLQKLFLSNNDLQSINDISSVSLALSLREITLENNPISLGGDCVSFLVSYLPNLCFLSQMQVTDQVRRAAMTWRQNKENNTINNEMDEETDVNIRREQIISNARTNWELLRSQNKCLSSSTVNNGPASEYILETNNGVKTDELNYSKNPRSRLSRNQANGKLNNLQNVKNCQTSNILLEKHNIGNRSTSQDTDISHSTSTSSELLKLPPILVPIIDSLEHQKINLGNDTSDTPNKKCIKRWESISSVDPVLNSSMSSLLTTTSDSESDVSKITTNKKQMLTANKKRATFATSKSVSISESNPSSVKLWTKNRSISDNSENMSIISAGTNLNSTITNSSTSGSDITNRTGRKETLSRAGSTKGRHIKSATIRRNLSKQMQNRAVTAKPKQRKNGPENNANINQTDSIVKDREQGSDWLVEVRGGQASVWGAGALKRLEKSWPSANDVTTIHFHYVSFSSICSVLAIIKNRFPNAVHMSFRACGVSCIGQLGALAALRGISSLSIHKDGNPLAGQSWHSYALYRLAHWGLSTLDHEHVTDADILASNVEYSGLSEVVLWSLPDTLLQPLLIRLQGEKDNSKQLEKDKENKGLIIREGNFRKENGCIKINLKENYGDGENDFIKYGTARCWLWNADATLRDVVAKEALQWRRTPMNQEEAVLRHRGRTHLSKVLVLTAGAAIKLRIFKRYWPTLLLQVLTTILYDFTHLQTHINERLKDIYEELNNDSIKK